MSTLTSIGTALPQHKHTQEALFAFADAVYSNDSVESRKLKFLYRQSGIRYRHSVIPDFSTCTADRKFFPSSADLEPFPGIESRMRWYNETATTMSVEAITNCIEKKIDKNEVTHLITVSCTGMSAPGLDLEIMEMMDLPSTIVRTSVNFMGCYAAIHAMKIADAFCKTCPQANVIVVCTELCTLHFQKDTTIDNITSSLLFADGSAAMLFQNASAYKGIVIDNFYSNVSFKGKKDMAWQISAKGFLMTLTGFVPDLIKEDFATLVDAALASARVSKSAITNWCIHPGGKKILDTILSSLQLLPEALHHSYDVLKDFGNMSSATIVFVLKNILQELEYAEAKEDAIIFGAAFGPGLTMETFTAHYG